MTKFQERLKKLRQESGLKQIELAEKIGVSKNTVSVWERGLQIPEQKALRKLSDFFGVSVAYIAGHSYQRNGEEIIDDTAVWLEQDDYLENMFEKVLRLSDDSRLIIREAVNKLYMEDQSRGNLRPEGQATVHITRHQSAEQ